MKVKHNHIIKENYKYQLLLIVKGSSENMSFRQLENAEFEFHILNKNWYIYQYVEKTK